MLIEKAVACLETCKDLSQARVSIWETKDFTKESLSRIYSICLHSKFLDFPLPILHTLTSFLFLEYLSPIPLQMPFLPGFSLCIENWWIQASFGFFYYLTLMLLTSLPALILVFVHSTICLQKVEEKDLFY